MIRAERVHWGQMLPRHAFLIARAAPLREVVADDRWRELVVEYRKLAEGEGRRYPTHVIHNDHTIEESLGRIVEIAEAG
jgi:hypothetical protein